MNQNNTEQPTSPGADAPAAQPASIRLVLSSVIGVCFLALPALLGFWLLASIELVGEQLTAFSGPMIAGIPLWGLLVYVLVFAVTSGLGILPTYAQAILGGWIFGLTLGISAALLGFTLGALIGWIFCRFVARDSVEGRIDRNPRWGTVRRAFVNESHWRTLGLVILVRFPPNSPFALTNLVLAASGVRLVPYVVGTFIGMSPRTAVACALAASAAATGATDIQSFVQDKGIWPLVIGLVVMFVTLAILSRIANAALARATNGA